MDADPVRSFTLIGIITHSFEMCELHLSEMFQLLCEAENDAPFQIFGQIVSSNLRLSMTLTALEECMPKASAMKDKVAVVLAEFKECQTLRNRAIHQSLAPHFTEADIAFVGRPLWHQTIRYKDGELKAGLEQTPEALSDTSYRLTTLIFAMRGVLEELSSFLAARKQRRLRTQLLGRERQLSARSAR